MALIGVIFIVSGSSLVIACSASLVQLIK